MLRIGFFLVGGEEGLDEESAPLVILGYAFLVPGLR